MIFYGWYIVGACFAISLYVAGVTFYGFTAFFEPVVAEFGWSYTSVSFAASIRGMEMGILAPVVGMLVDRLGSRMFMFLGVIFLGAGLVLLGFTQSLPMFYGAFMLISFGAGGCTTVVSMTVVANWFERNVGKAMGMMASGFGASGLLVPGIVWLIETYDWRTAAIILGIGMWLIGFPLAAVIRNTPEECGYFPDGIQPAKPPPRQSEPPDYTGTLNFSSTLMTRGFIFLGLAEMLRMAALAAVVTHIMPYLGNIGISRTAGGFIAAGIPLLSVVGRLGFGWLSDIMEKRYVMAIAFAMMAIGVLIFSYIEGMPLVYVFLLLFSTGYGGIMVLRAAILRDYYGKSSFGKLIGILIGASAVGGIVGPTVAGWVFDSTGSYILIWRIFCLTLAIATFLLITIKPPAKTA
ncbi:MAG: MFS transporter [Desulfobacteraceae bacterium]|nr:MFS transporter [Desulfobacteraceae bacterium]